MALFTERLRALREERHLKQEEAAAEIGIPYRSYRRYEAGDSSPTVPTLLLLADFFNVSTDYLTGRSDAR